MAVPAKKTKARKHVEGSHEKCDEATRKDTLLKVTRYSTVPVQGLVFISTHIGILGSPKEK